MSPRLSVVMSVFNGAITLPETLDSVLTQTERDFELLVVDDGSSDETPAILARYAAADRRVRVISQPNAGLTRALIRGCAEAHAAVIARQDCGDVSLPRRFEIGLSVFAAKTDCVLTSGAVEAIGPGGESLYVTSGDDSIRDTLLRAPLGRIRGLPHHGAAMFLTEAYRRCGGYRPELYFAQDLDLWIRLAALGEIVFSPETTYRARIDVAGISGRHRLEQVESARLSISLRDAPEAARGPLLAQIARIRPMRHKAPSRRQQANALYFIGACLRRRSDPRATFYLRDAIRRNPLHARAWLSLLGVKR